jgi:hypothetical protein
MMVAAIPAFMPCASIVVPSASLTPLPQENLEEETQQRQLSRGDQRRKQVETPCQSCFPDRCCPVLLARQSPCRPCRIRDILAVKVLAR